MAGAPGSAKPDPSLGDWLRSDWGDLGLGGSQRGGWSPSVTSQQICEWNLTPSREQGLEITERRQLAGDRWCSLPLEQFSDLRAHLSLTGRIAITREGTFPPSSLQHLANGHVQLQEDFLHADFPILTREQSLMVRLAEPSFQKSKAVRVRRLHEPCQPRRHAHHPDFPSGARSQKLAPEVRIARVHQEDRLPLRCVPGKDLTPVPRDHGENGIVHPSAFPAHQAHVRE